MSPAICIKLTLKEIINRSRYRWVGPVSRILAISLILKNETSLVIQFVSFGNRNEAKTNKAIFHEMKVFMRNCLLQIL